MKRMTIATTFAAVAVPLALVAQEQTDAVAVAADVPAVVEATAETADASAEAVKQDAAITIDADEQCQAAFDEFLEKKSKSDPTVTAYGEPNSSGIIYYSEAEAVTSKSASDPDFLKKRQMAFARAFQQIRNSYVKYSFKSFLVSGEKGSFLHDGDALKKQDVSEVDALKRLGQKVLALSEAKVDQELQKAGVDPSKFASLPAKRKMLSRSIVRGATVRSLGTCTGISVVKTVEGKGSDGAFSVGVIAKYDPEAVVIADCMVRKTRPTVLPKTGIPLGLLLQGDKLAENFGTRLYYDESGMPALLSFGQWSSSVTPGMDRYERKMLEKAAFQQAEAQANIDMNNFLAGHMTYDEMTKAGERYDVSVVYSDDGVPVGRSADSEIDDMANWNSETTAKDSLAGRRRVFAKTLKHPDTSAMVTLVAVNWSFKNIDQLRRDAELRKPRKPGAVSAPVEKKPGAPRLREGDTYDF